MRKSKYAKENYAMLKRKIWITIRFTSRRGFRFLSPPNRTSCASHSSTSDRVGDSGWSSCGGGVDGDSLIFHTCLADRLSVDVGESSFSGPSSS
jgi:hypothetical protein